MLKKVALLITATLLASCLAKRPADSNEKKAMFLSDFSRAFDGWNIKTTSESNRAASTFIMNRINASEFNETSGDTGLSSMQNLGWIKAKEGEGFRLYCKAGAIFEVSKPYFGEKHSKKAGFGLAETETEWLFAYIYNHETINFCKHHELPDYFNGTYPHRE